MEQLKASLLEAAKLRTKSVKVGDVKVKVREVGTVEFAEYGELHKVDKSKATASLIASCVVDDDGNPMLTLDEAIQLSKSARMSIGIVGAIMELSGFSEPTEKKADAG